jgi:hypothetical protein
MAVIRVHTLFLNRGSNPGGRTLNYHLRSIFHQPYEGLLRYVIHTISRWNGTVSTINYRSVIFSGEKFIMHFPS